MSEQKIVLNAVLDEGYKGKHMRHYTIGKPGDNFSGGLYIRTGINPDFNGDITISFKHAKDIKKVSDQIDIGD
jgi:hypothetical protein